jgi:glycolate oxidase iron-sulfur subunit
MQTNLADWLRDTPDGIEADSILRSCVHCGFCTATCPTYQLLGDELDGPRGRIYLIKQVVEGVTPTRETQQHLDRCLTCRNCESTCPSGVQYGHLVDIGRKLVDRQVERPAADRLLRGALREGMTRRALFDTAMRIGQTVRPLLPEALRAKVPQRRDPGAWPVRSHARKVILLNGCVQPAMVPAIDAATARVLDALGIEAVVAPRSGCCGAIRHHLDDQEGALDDARRNIDAWWPLLASDIALVTAAGAGDEASRASGAGGAEAIVMNASGCGAMIKDYAHLLRHDPLYAEKAARVSAMTRDLAEFLPAERERLQALCRAPVGDHGDHGAQAGPVRAGPPRLAFHPPCTLQHGQQIKGEVELLLRACGAEIVPFAESHLCCGSAGTYSVLQPALATQLRDRKLASLQADSPDQILSANIGCLTHLQSGTDTPVRHWIEWLDRAIART